jgi:hypothetical protein
MDPHWVVVAWATIFVAINLGHSSWLIYERYLQRLTEEEQRLYDCCFQALDPVSVLKLLRRGEWIDFAPQDSLARQGIHLDRLLLVSSGEAAVPLGGKIVARRASGKFVALRRHLHRHGGRDRADALPGLEEGEVGTAARARARARERFLCRRWQGPGRQGRAPQRRPVASLNPRLRVGPPAPSSTAAGTKVPAILARFCAIY